MGGRGREGEKEGGETGMNSRTCPDIYIFLFTAGEARALLNIRSEIGGSVPVRPTIPGPSFVFKRV